MALWESEKVDAGYDAKVIRTTFEGEEEVGVVCGVGVGDNAAGEDDLEILDVRAGEAVEGGEEG